MGNVAINLHFCKKSECACNTTNKNWGVINSVSHHDKDYEYHLYISRQSSSQTKSYLLGIEYLYLVIIKYDSSVRMNFR